jgi:ectoine hydroxylase-related dioxygenase (phytanoyl-CoA dioxygenase family)
MMLHDGERQRLWARDGLFVVSRAFDNARVRQLASACDRALEHVRATSNATGHTTTNISPLLHPECFADEPEALQCLVQLASSPDVIALVRDLGKPGEGELNLRDLQYFHEPKRDHDGPWHRDGASVAQPESIRPTVLRFRVALAADDHLEYVLGSHARPDTEGEQQVLAGSRRNGTLPTEARRVALEPGDVCVFDAGGIHRARYRSRAARKTLDLLFAFGVRRRTFDPALLEFARRTRTPMESPLGK